MLIIESDDIKGAAMFNGFLAYGADVGQLTTEAQIADTVTLINNNYLAGKVDNPANLNSAPTYVYRGDTDVFDQKPQSDLFKSYNSYS